MLVLAKVGMLDLKISAEDGNRKTTQGKGDIYTRKLDSVDKSKPMSSTMLKTQMQCVHSRAV